MFFNLNTLSNRLVGKVIDRIPGYLNDLTIAVSSGDILPFIVVFISEILFIDSCDLIIFILLLNNHYFFKACPGIAMGISAYDNKHPPIDKPSFVFRALHPTCHPVILPSYHPVTPSSHPSSHYFDPIFRNLVFRNFGACG